MAFDRRRGRAAVEAHQVFAVSRICRNMRKSGYRDKEISLILPGSTWRDGQDMREAWWVINRRHLPQLSRAEFQGTLLDILGDEARSQSSGCWTSCRCRRAECGRQRDSRDGRAVRRRRADLGFAEFSQLMTQVAGASAGESFDLSREVSEMASGAAACTRCLPSASTRARLADPARRAAARGRGGRAHAAGGLHAAAGQHRHLGPLRLSRPALLVWLWGSFDKQRAGHIPTEVFDRAMLLFSDALAADQLAELRAQLGFVTPGEARFSPAPPPPPAPRRPAPPPPPRAAAAPAPPLPRAAAAPPPPPPRAPTPPLRVPR